MNLKYNLFVALIAFLGVTMAVSGNLGIQHENSLSLLSFMTRSSDVLQSNPARSLDCFDYYLPLLQQINQRYETNFKDCKDATAASKANAESATLEQRNDLAKRSSDSCALLSHCSESNLTTNAFECFAKGGSDSQVVMHNINSDAIQYLADYNRQLFLIDLDDEVCTNATKKTYEKESAKAYSDMNDCLTGKTEVPKPTDPPATDPPATDPPATDPPATDPPATDPPATDPPATDPPATDPPATDPPATDPPATDPPATDAPSTEEPEPTPQDKLPEEDIYALRKALESRMKKRRY